MTHPKSTNPKDPIHGILLIDKPQGLSSNGVLQRVKSLLGAKKAGHTGSLDPMATGMLPICFGEATKVSQYLLEADKCYTTTGLLGVKTNTGDAMGDVIACVDNVDVSLDQLQAALAQFKGKSKQIPSMFSALKYQGKPLYQYARKGVEIEREAREIIIYDLHLDAFDGKQFKLTVRCSKGTYIRNLVEDIGEKLGVGAHVTELRRLYTAGFDSNTMITIEQLMERNLEERRALLLPIESAVPTLPRFTLSATQVQQIRQGQIVTTDPIHSVPGVIMLFDETHSFIGFGEWQLPHELKAKRLLAIVS